MKIRRGFTLVELAIVLVVLGLIAAMVVPTLKSGILRGKMSEARATLQAVRDGVIGVAQANSRILPATLAPLGAPKDPWGNAIRYRRDPGLTGDVCAANATSGTFVSPEGQTIADVAFVVASSGPDFQEDAALNASTDARQADDDLILAVTLPHLKTILCADRAKGAQTPGALATWNDILLHTSGPNNVGANITSNSIVLGIPSGTNTTSFTYGCVWYTGNLNATSGAAVCTSGNCTLGKGLRAYFTFTVEKIGTTPLADGFTFAVVSAATNTHQSCGGKGSALGYASTFNQPGDDGVPPFVLPPKMAVEFDFYTSGGFNDPGSHLDHLGIAYWGNNTGSSDLDRAKTTSNTTSPRLTAARRTPIPSALPTKPISTKPAPSPTRCAWRSCAMPPAGITPPMCGSTAPGAAILQSRAWMAGWRRNTATRPASISAIPSP